MHPFHLRNPQRQPGTANRRTSRWAVPGREPEQAGRPDSIGIGNRFREFQRSLLLQDICDPLVIRTRSNSNPELSHTRQAKDRRVKPAFFWMYPCSALDL